MPKFNRIRISKNATSKLRALKSKTGLTPNILCRMALCFSLEHEKTSDLLPMDEEGQEFNRVTLLGDYDAYYVALVKEWCTQQNLNPEKEFMDQLKAHINHGVLAIHSRVKDLSELTHLVEVKHE